MSANLFYEKKNLLLTTIQTYSAEHHTGMGSRKHRFKPHAVAAALPRLFSSLVCHTLCYRNCANPPRLGDEKGFSNLIMKCKFIRTPPKTIK